MDPMASFNMRSPQLAPFSGFKTGLYSKRRYKINVCYNNSNKECKTIHILSDGPPRGLYVSEVI